MHHAKTPGALITCAAGLLLSLPAIAQDQSESSRLHLRYAGTDVGWVLTGAEAAQRYSGGDVPRIPLWPRRPRLAEPRPARTVRLRRLLRRRRGGALVRAGGGADAADRHAGALLTVGGPLLLGGWIVLVVCALGTLILGLYPQPIIEMVNHASVFLR